MLRTRNANKQLQRAKPLSREKEMKCPECEGRGKIEQEDQSEWVNATQYYKCPMCRGSGESPKYCPTCHREISQQAVSAEPSA